MRWRIDWVSFGLVLLTPAIAFAHCDIPCGIYSPWIATLAARTVWTMVKKILDLKTPQDGASEVAFHAHHNTIARMVRVKEDHAETCKRELQILWSDYFKPEHLAMFPDLHDTFWKAAKLCSYNKQHVDLAKAQELLDAVAKISELFQKAEAAKKK